MFLKELYDRFKAEIEAEQNVVIERLELVDNDGYVTVKVTPKIQQININFAHAGEPIDEGIEDVEINPTEDGDGIIIEWGESNSEGISVLNMSTKYRIYRNVDGGKFEQIAETSSNRYEDSPLEQGKIYEYYVVTVINGKEGIPSKKRSLQL